MAAAPVEFSAVSCQLLEALEVLDRSIFPYELRGVKGVTREGGSGYQCTLSYKLFGFLRIDRFSKSDKGTSPDEDKQLNNTRTSYYLAQENLGAIQITQG